MVKMTKEMQCHTITDPELAEVFEQDAARGGGCKCVWGFGLHSDEQEAIAWNGWESLAATLRVW